MSDAQHLPLDARWLRERARNEPSRLNAETMRAMADRIERVAATLAGLRENKLVAVAREVDEAIFKRACQLAGCFPDSVMGVHGRCLVIAYLAAAQDRTP